MKRLPKVVAKITIESWHGEEAEGEPGHETLIQATYRDLPETALIQLEKVAANTVEQMANYGEALIEKGESMAGNKECCNS